MTQFSHLWLFFILVFGVVVLPGMDMAYILGSALTGGLRTGLMALGGIVAAGVYHVLLGTLGIGVLLKLWPAAFNALLLAGSLYIAWIGWSIFKGAAAFSLSPEVQSRPPWATFCRGIVTSVLNPKAYLFTLAVYPQFIRPEYGPLAIQALAMWVIIAVTQIGIYGSGALAADRVRVWLASNPNSGLIVGRVVGVVLILGAVYTGISGWRSL
jgi:threonine/homoserine/homoserine lactone efflux protein